MVTATPVKCLLQQNKKKFQLFVVQNRLVSIFRAISSKLSYIFSALPPTFKAHTGPNRKDHQWNHTFSKILRIPKWQECIIFVCYPRWPQVWLHGAHLLPGASILLLFTQRWEHCPIGLWTYCEVTLCRRSDLLGILVQTMPSVNYGKGWLDELFPIPGLIWSRKEFHRWMWSWGRS